MKNLDAKLLKQFLKLAGANLEGEWLLVGGTLLPAVGMDIRSTVDIDLVGLGSVEAGQTLELMEIVEKLGLSVETINQAAAYFVKKVGYTKKDLLPLHEGKSATIFRPSLELYWKLKMTRLSESDAQDCKQYLNYCNNRGDKIDYGVLIKSLKTQIKSKTCGPDRLERLNALMALPRE